MKKAIALISALLLTAGAALAANPTSFAAAKKLSAQNKKPLLIEFFQPDCDFCQLAEKDFAANDSVIKALNSVVYLLLDVSSEEGERLSSIYYVRNEYPVFVLADSSGEIIDHWTGYNSAAPLISRLNKALASPITIKARYEMLKSSPALENAIFLAKYNEEIGDNLKSAELYRQAQDMRNSKTYIYDIFQNTADAVWNGKLHFRQLLPAADDVLVVSPGNAAQVAGVARIIGNVARKTGSTSEIARYLKAGMDITAGREDIRSREWHALFAGDWALYVERDTAGAIAIEKESLGAGWENRPGKFYSYAGWCLDRKINLDEAETFARQAVERSSEGKFRGSILSTLAEICEARGEFAEAAEAMENAVKQEPANTFYVSEAKRLRAMAGGEKLK